MNYRGLVASLAIVLLATGCGGDADTVAQLEQRIAELEAEQESQSTEPVEAPTTTVATTTTNPPTTTTQATSTTAQPATTTTTPTITTIPKQSISGVVETQWLIDKTLLTGDSRSTCESVTDEYQVEIRDGGGFVLAVIPLSSPRTNHDVVDDIFHDLSCTFTYSATVEYFPVYVFTLSDRDEILESRNVNGSDAVSKGAPTFAVIFSCIVGVGCRTNVY